MKLSLKEKNPLAFSQKESGPMVQGFTFENCGKSSDPIKVTKLQLGPDPVKIPGNISLAVNASTSKVLAAPIKVIESNLFDKMEPRKPFYNIFVGKLYNLKMQLDIKVYVG